MVFADVAVVLPVFNRKTMVIEALDSVAAQKPLPSRLIVVDDGSTDGTGEAVGRRLQRSDLPCETRLIRQRNRGVSAARNRGIAEAGACKYLAFLDSDDLWPPDYLHRTTAAMEAAAEAVAASCDVRVVYADSPRRELRRSSEFAVHSTRWLLESQGLITPCTLVRTGALWHDPWFDPTMPIGEDWKFFLQLSLRGPWLYVPGEPVTVRRNFSLARDEYDHLTHHHREMWAVLAEMLTEVLGAHRSQLREIATECDDVLARAWYRAGKEHMRNRDLRRARESFRRSIHFQRRNKAWLRLVQNWCLSGVGAAQSALFAGTRGRECPAAARRVPTIVIGLGTGRCGTMSLARLLDLQDRADVTHERCENRIAWKGSTRRVVATLRGLAKHARAELVGDVASYYLPYVERILAKFPRAKFVCLQRDREATVRSFMKKTRDRNHWIRHDGRVWRRDGWDPCFPKYVTTSKEAALRAYWDEYYRIARDLQSRFPASFRIFPTEALNRRAGQAEILDFVGVAPERRRTRIPLRHNAGKHGDPEPPAQDRSAGARRDVA